MGSSAIVLRKKATIQGKIMRYQYIGEIYANGINTVGQVWIDKNLIFHLYLCLPKGKRLYYKDIEHITVIRFRYISLLLETVRSILSRNNIDATIRLEYRLRS